jgi:peptidoglycan/xylan/chitin deacetylase (PgdA/CDA1 family)
MSRATRLIQKVERFVAPFCERRTANLNYDKGMICFTFDDVWRSACSNGAAILERHGVQGTFYVCGGLTGTTSYHTHADLSRLISAGHELGSHGFGHFSYQSLSRADILTDLQKNRAFFETLGCDPPQHFAFPYGHVSPFSKRVVADEFVSVRGISPGINYAVVDLALLMSFPLYRHLWTDATLIEIIAENARRRGLLIFFSHGVRGDPGEYDTSIEMLEFAVRTSVASGNTVAPLRDALSTRWMAVARARDPDALSTIGVHKKSGGTL